MGGSGAGGVCSLRRRKGEEVALSSLNEGETLSPRSEKMSFRTGKDKGSTRVGNVRCFEEEKERWLPRFTPPKKEISTYNTHKRE